MCSSMLQSRETIHAVSVSVTFPLPRMLLYPLKKKSRRLSGLRRPGGLRITQPAMTLMQELGVSLEQLPQDTLITEKYVRELFAPAARRIDPTAWSSTVARPR